MLKFMWFMWKSFLTIFEDIHKKNPVGNVRDKSNDTGDNLGRLLRGIYMHLQMLFSYKSN